MKPLIMGLLVLFFSMALIFFGILLIPTTCDFLTKAINVSGVPILICSAAIGGLSSLIVFTVIDRFY